MILGLLEDIYSHKDAGTEMHRGRLVTYAQTMIIEVYVRDGPR